MLRLIGSIDSLLKRMKANPAAALTVAGPRRRASGLLRAEIYGD